LGRRAPTLRAFATTAAALALAVATLAAGGCREQGVPDALVGRWISHDPRYAGRSLSIDRETITFDAGGALGAVHAIVAVDTADPGGLPVHTVRYRESDGATTSVTLEVVPGAPVALRFENHDELWVRDHGRR